MSEQNQQPEVAAEEQQEAVLQIQRIYVKDVSFEAPNLPHIFHQEWKPKLGFDLSTEAVQVGEDLYEVTLNINVETTMALLLLLIRFSTSLICSIEPKKPL